MASARPTWRPIRRFPLNLMPSSRALAQSRLSSAFPLKCEAANASASSGPIGAAKSIVIAWRRSVTKSSSLSVTKT